VVARGYFGDDAAIHCVQIHLAVQGVGEQAKFRGIQRNSGLVAAGFDTENNARLSRFDPGLFMPRRKA
jgi:hypothetical protein